MFQDVAVWDMQHHSEHYMVLGYLRGDPEKDLTGYLRKVRFFPLWTLRRDLALAPEIYAVEDVIAAITD